ncbi:MAG: DUF4836 family protein, partial [Bacteroidales bacterium]|nr:DUF4836 family protein [Bacteroidales bacterium]
MKSFKFTLLGISALLFIACSKKSEHISVIPVSATSVIVVDAYSIMQKGNLKDISELQSFQTMKEKLRNENKSASNLLDEMIKNPEMTGIDFKSDLFIFQIEENDNKFVNFSAKVGDETKIDAFFKKLLEASGETDFSI